MYAVNHSQIKTNILRTLKIRTVGMQEAGNYLKGIFNIWVFIIPNKSNSALLNMSKLNF